MFPAAEGCQAVCHVYKKVSKQLTAALASAPQSDTSCKKKDDLGKQGAPSNVQEVVAVVHDPVTVQVDASAHAAFMAPQTSGQCFAAECRPYLNSFAAAHASSSIPGTDCNSPAVECLLMGAGSQLQCPQGPIAAAAVQGGGQAVVAVSSSAQVTPSTCEMPAIHVLGTADVCCGSSSMALDVQSQQQLSGTAGEGSAVPDGPADVPLLAAGAEGTEEGKGVATISLGTTLFFARVPPTVEVDTIRALFERYGEVKELNLFRPWATAKTSKGCGIVVYEQTVSCVAAMNALHNKYHWTGGETTMVVEWADPNRQRQENPNVKGVFEAKHKTMKPAGSRSRYRSQMMKHMSALGLHGPCTVPSFFTTPPYPISVTPKHNRAPPVLPSRGVLAMAPQLAAPAAAGLAGRWGVGLQGPAALHGYSTAGLAGASAGGVSSGSLLNPAAVMSRTSSYPGACMGNAAAAGGAGLNTAAGACLVQPVLSDMLPGRGGAPPFNTTAMGTAQQAGSYTTGSRWVMSGSEGLPLLTPGNPSVAYMEASGAFTPQGTNLPVLHRTDLRPVLTVGPLQHTQHQQQQQGYGLSRYGPAAAVRLASEGCSSACSTPDCCRQAGTFDSLVQQQIQLQQPQSVTYLSANAGLVADASVLAAAAAVLLPPQLQAVRAGPAECYTPLSCVSDAAAGAATFSTGIMAAPAAVPGTAQCDSGGRPTQQYWLMQHRQQEFGGSSSSLPTLLDGSAGIAGMDSCGSAHVHPSRNLVAMALASASGTPVGTPTYMHQQVLGNPQAAFDAGGLCGSGNDLSEFAGGYGSGWM